MAPKAMDIFTKEGNNGASIAALRQEFKQNLLVSFFKTPEELASLVSQAIHNWEIHHEASKEGLLLKNDVHTKAERETRLKAIMADHTGFLRGRLESFVGREVELAAIRQRIAEKLTSGGYVTITGQAGQGKSSIIAKLVSEYEETKAAFHFIPFNPGPDHQVGLLRNLIARLVLRYDLPEFYVPSESRPALRDYFPKVLHEVVAKGGQEVIFIDGLDQLEEEQSGVRDLSFLPNNPPQGIVFVLGTRPNDTLKPLELLKPRHEYKLPNLSRKDFDLILQRRQVQLDKELTDQLYRIMQENALYLDLIAKELAQEKAVRPEDIITRVVNDPEAIFSLSIDRLQKKPNDVEWHEVLKPILVVLLVTREPLTSRHIRQIIQTRHIQNVDDQQIRNGLMRLGGLLTDDRRKRYALFHLKLYDYLRQDKTKPEKSYVFATDEEESWHNTLVLWCESGDISRIWDNTEYDIVEQVRRGYARRHYITHLYNAQEWQKLLNILDDGAYGQAKVRFDPSMRAYAQDLDLGRQVAASTHWGLQEGLNKLAHLWRYTLLRCSLASRADKYSIKAFRLLLLLKRETEALNLAELLTTAAYKVDVLREIAKLIGQQPGRESEYIQLLLRACEIAYKIENDKEKNVALQRLGTSLAQAQEWEQAEVVLRSIEPKKEKAQALQELAKLLADVQLWQPAKALWNEAETLKIEAARANEDLLPGLKTSTNLTRVEIGDVELEWARDFENEDIFDLEDVYNESLEKTDELLQSTALAIIPTRSSAGSSSHTSQTIELQSRVQNPQSMHAQAMLNLLQQQVSSLQALREQGETRAAQEIEYIKAKCTETFAAIKELPDAVLRANFLCKLGTILTGIQEQKWAEAIWADAEVAIQSILPQDEKMKALQEFGIILMQAQEQAWAEKEWIQLEEIIHSLKQLNQKAIALGELGAALSQVQMKRRAEALWANAEAIARSITNSEQQDETTKELSNILVKAGEWKRARTVAQSIQSYQNRLDVLCELAYALTKAQMLEQAETVWIEVEKVAIFLEDHLLGYTETLKEVINSLVQAKRWELARFIARKLFAAGEVEILCILGKALVEAQERKFAEEVWIEAKKIAISTPIFEKMDLLCLLGKALVEVQEWKLAEAVWIEAKEVAHSESSEYWREGMLCTLGEALIEVHEWKRAENIWSEIIMILNAIEHNYEQDRSLRELGKALAQIQEWERAEQILRSLQEQWHREEALKELSESLANAQLWERAEQILRSLQEQWRREEALQELGRTLANTREWERAKNIHLSLQEWWRRQEALQELSRVYAHLQEWELSEQVIRSIEHPDEQAIAFRELIWTLAQTREWDRAEIVWARALLAVSTMEQRAHISLATNGLFAALAHSGEEERWEQLKMINSMVNGYKKRHMLQMLINRLDGVFKKTTHNTERTKTLVHSNKTMQVVLIANDDFAHYQQMLRTIQQAWRQADTRVAAIKLLPLVANLIPLKPEIGISCRDAFTWVDTFLKG